MPPAPTRKSSSSATRANSPKSTPVDYCAASGTDSSPSACRRTAVSTTPGNVPRSQCCATVTSTTALAAYHAHERIVAAPTASMTRQTMVADWWAARLAGQHTLMVAARWHDVDDLNARARQLVIAQGLVSGPTLQIDGRPYQAGDEIMTLRNQRRLGVRNGTIAVITAVAPDARAITVRSAHGTHMLPADYLDTGQVRHAYATTIHKAQGITVDQALVLGDDTLYQEAGYVALSRGRAQNRLYLVARPEDDEQHTRTPERPPLDQVAGALRVSRAQRLAIDQHIATPKAHERVAQLYEERNRIRALLSGAAPDQTANIERAPALARRPGSIPGRRTGPAIQAGTATPDPEPTRSHDTPPRDSAER